MTSKAGYAQVRGGTCGEKTRYRYYGMEMGDANVGRLSCTKAQKVVLADREGGGISLGDKSNSGKDGQGGTGIIDW